MLPPHYEVDTIAQDCVMAHFSCIHYVPVGLLPLTYFSKNSIT